MRELAREVVVGGRARRPGPHALAHTNTGAHTRGHAFAPWCGHDRDNVVHVVPIRQARICNIIYKYDIAGRKGREGRQNREVT